MRTLYHREWFATVTGILESLSVSRLLNTRSIAFSGTTLTPLFSSIDIMLSDELRLLSESESLLRPLVKL